jgi:hypothetical protein
VQEIGDSRQQTEDQCRELILQEKNLITDLENNEGGLESKLQRWAQIVEELVNSANQNYNFTISQISTYIRRECYKRKFKFSHNVDRYLSEKYKNPNMVRIHRLEDKLEDTLCPQIEGKPLEQLSRLEMEFEKELIRKTRDEADKEIMRLNHKEEELDQEAIRRGYDEFGGEKIRDQISERDYRYDIPDYFGIDELNNEVILQGNRWIKALDVFFNKKYPDRPGHIRQEIYKWANALRVIANVHEVINEDKWSGDLSFWFDREYHAKIQSKHDAGNSTMWDSTLCHNCSQNIDEDPKDCVKMKYWRPSPTGYICGQCGGTKILDRENTREQVGDKEADVYRNAADVLNHIPFYADVFVSYVSNVKSPAIYARKAAIHEPFSKSAISGVGAQVIPRKKTKSEQ